MPTDGSTPTQKSLPSVFLSYASQDREAAQAIRDALSASGLDAWYDESDLHGGDASDQKIRRQIGECDFFMPVISAQTEGRSEGYFRREWRFAVERTLDMAWVPGGKPTPAFEALCRRLASGQAFGMQPPKKGAAAPAAGASPARPAATPYPEFPRQDPEHKAQFYGRVLLWLVSAAGCPSTDSRGG